MEIHYDFALFLSISLHQACLAPSLGDENVDHGVLVVHSPALLVVLVVRRQEESGPTARKGGPRPA